MGKVCMSTEQAIEIYQSGKCSGVLCSRMKWQIRIGCSPNSMVSGLDPIWKKSSKVSTSW